MSHTHQAQDKGMSCLTSMSSAVLLSQDLRQYTKIHKAWHGRKIADLSPFSCLYHSLLLFTITQISSSMQCPQNIVRNWFGCSSNVFRGRAHRKDVRQWAYVTISFACLRKQTIQSAASCSCLESKPSTCHWLLVISLPSGPQHSKDWFWLIITGFQWFYCWSLVSSSTLPTRQTQDRGMSHTHQAQDKGMSHQHVKRRTAFSRPPTIHKDTQSMAWQKDRRSLSFFISLSFSPSLHYHSDLFKHAVPSEHSKELIWLFFKCLQWKGTSQGCASSCGQRSLSVLLASENRRYSLLQVALV